MVNVNENFIRAIKGEHNQQPNKVSDSKLNDLDSKLAQIRDSVDGSSQINGVSTLAKQPFPARVRANEKNGFLRFPGYTKRYKALDKKGNLYATTATALQKLPAEEAIGNLSSSWPVVWEVPDQNIYGQINSTAVMITDTNRIVIGTQKGFTFVSDEDQINFTEIGLQFSFDEDSQRYAYTHFQFGYGHYDNLVWVSGYANAPVDANRSFISEDYGETWRECAEIPIVTTDTNRHIHDMQYDPYADRFWLVMGDQTNCNTFYSDDFCRSWVAVYDIFANEIRNTQLTSIACYPHGVVFGSDHAVDQNVPYGNNLAPDCLFYWKRPKGITQPEVDPDNIELIFRPYKDDTFRSFAIKVWQGKIGNNIVTLMPWYGIAPDTTFLLASVDGLTWFEIYRGAKPGSFQIAGVTEINGIQTILGFDRNSNDQISLLNIPMPEWI